MFANRREAIKLWIAACAHVWMRVKEIHQNIFLWPCFVVNFIIEEKNWKNRRKRDDKKETKHTKSDRSKCVHTANEIGDFIRF